MGRDWEPEYLPADFDRQAYEEEFKKQIKIRQLEMYGRVLTEEEINNSEELERERREMGIVQERLNKFIRSIPPRFEIVNFDNYICKTEKQRKAVEWLKTGESAVIYGANGIGKTHLAYAACIHQANQGKRPFYILALDLFTEIKQSFKDGSTLSVVNDYVGYDYLVIDEVDKTYASETDFIYFFSIINKRYNFLRPTVLIANSANISDISGKSSFDRIASEGRVIYLDGDNFRQKK